jgi:hypothetical protein
MMGREAQCRARYQQWESAGTLRHETDDLLFRGDFRLKIPLKQITKAIAQEGALSVHWPDGVASFELGAAASKWADAVNNPKSLLDKLGVKPEHAVSVVGVENEDFLDDLRRRVATLTMDKPAPGSDIIFFQADDPKRLETLKQLARKIQPAGAVWVITPRQRPEIADTVVIAAGKAAGLVDVKVARFSETHTALRFVIPAKKR